MNWMRWNVPPSTSATVLIVSVFARPGTPSISRWPPASRQTKTRSSIASWPAMTRLISNTALLEQRALPRRLVAAHVDVPDPSSVLLSRAGRAGRSETELEVAQWALQRPVEQRFLKRPCERPKRFLNGWSLAVDTSARADLSQERKRPPGEEGRFIERLKSRGGVLFALRRGTRLADPSNEGFVNVSAGGGFGVPPRPRSARLPGWRCTS